MYFQQQLIPSENQRLNIRRGIPPKSNWSRYLLFVEWMARGDVTPGLGGFTFRSAAIYFSGGSPSQVYSSMSNRAMAYEAHAAVKFSLCLQVFTAIALERNTTL